MKLRNKSLLYITFTMFFVVLLLWFITQRVLISGFEKVELDNALGHIARITVTLNEITENLQLKAVDWSKWDATYQFVNDHNEKFITSSLTDEVLSSLRLNFAMILDSTNNVIYSLQYYLDMELASSLSPGIRNAIINDTLLTNRNSNAIHTGIIIADSLPVLITVQSITSSTGKAHSNGKLIFGRFLDIDEIARLQQLTHMSIQLTRFNRQKWQRLTAIEGSYTIDSTVVIQRLTEESLAAYMAISDMHDRRVCILKINLPRDIYKQGLLTNNYILTTILLTGLILSIVILLILEKTVIRRIDKLDRDVTAIKKSSDNSFRVSISGSDEIAHFASSMNEMLAALELKESQIEKRNSEMRFLMNSVPIGLLSIDEKLIINPEYSQSVESMIFKRNLAGKDFITTFAFNQTDTKIYESVIDYLELLMQNKIADSDIESLNPCEEYKYTVEDTTRWLQMRFFPIKRGKNLPDHILIIIENITDKKELAERISLSENENLQLKLIAEDPDLFSELLTELNRLLDNALVTLHSGTSDITLDKINSIFRDVHTIKGSAGPFGLDMIVGIASRIEDALVQLRETLKLDNTSSNFLQYNLSRMKNEVHKTVDILRNLFGDDFNENPDIHLRIPLERIKTEFNAFDSILQQSCLTTDRYNQLRSIIYSHFVNLRMVTAKRGLAKALKTAPNVISRLQKNVSLVITGENTMIDCEIARDLNNPLIHLIRNCLDHGIEESETERIELGKSPQGTLLIIIRKSDTNTITIDVTDDGRGIDPDYMKANAVAQGILSQDAASQMNDKDAIQLILKPGFSTAATSTEFSGRGVGMDVVNMVIREKLNGQLSILSQKRQGTTFRITIPATNQIVSDYQST